MFVLLSSPLFLQFLALFPNSLIPFMCVDQWRHLVALQRFWITNRFFYDVTWTFFPKLEVPLGSFSLWLFDALAQVSNKKRFCMETLTDRINWKDNLEAECHILGLPRQRHFEAKRYYIIIYIIELYDGLMVSADICNKVANEVDSLRQIPPGH